MYINFRVAISVNFKWYMIYMLQLQNEAKHFKVMKSWVKFVEFPWAFIFFKKIQRKRLPSQLYACVNAKKDVFVKQLRGMENDNDKYEKEKKNLWFICCWINNLLKEHVGNSNNLLKKYIVAHWLCGRRKGTIKTQENRTRTQSHTHTDTHEWAHVSTDTIITNKAEKS